MSLIRWLLLSQLKAKTETICKSEVATSPFPGPPGRGGSRTDFLRQQAGMFVMFSGNAEMVELEIEMNVGAVYSETQH